MIRTMNRQHALNQLRLMQAWHEDNGNGPCPDYDAICYAIGVIEAQPNGMDTLIRALEKQHQRLLEFQPAQPTQLTDDDIETIRIHLSAFKEKLCNQHRCNEAKEYEASIDRLTAQPRRTGHWHITDAYPHNVYCSECHKRFAQTHWAVWEDGSLPRNFCPNCGAKMTEGEAE